MNIFVTHSRRRHGSVVLVLLILLALMMLLAAANGRALFQLHQELKLIERRQVVRLDATSTNAVANVAFPVRPESK